MDQRGYNLSDQPEGEESYNMEYLVSDVAALIRHFGVDKATIVGHDWGWNRFMAICLRSARNGRESGHFEPTPSQWFGESQL